MRVEGGGLKVETPGSRVWILGFRVQVSEVGVRGLGSRARDSGFKI